MSYIDLLDGRVPPGKLASKTVLIGASAIEGWTVNEYDEPVAGDQGDTTRVNQAGAVFITPSGSLTY